MARLISKVYGDALFAAAREKGSIDTAYEEILFLRKLFKDNIGFKKIFDSPKISREEKLNTVKAVFENSLSEDVIAFLSTVIEKNRQSEFIEIFDYFIRLVKEYKKIGVACITSASKLSLEEKKAIEGKLLETTAYESFEMHFKVDESLIGGMVIRINDRIVDSSIKTRLNDIKRKLISLRMT